MILYNPLLFTYIRTMNEEITVIAGGDTSPANVDPPEETFERCEGLLSSADVSFAQVERVLSNRGESFRLDPHSRVDPATVTAYSAAGFNVVSLASNHTYDFGGTALLDTIDVFEEQGIEPIGAGADLDAAREPFVFEKGDTTVAILAYCSVLLPGYWATEKKPGIAPARAHTYYDSYEYQPGSPARVITEPYEEDIENVETDIEQANEIADYVITSFHWGNHFLPGHINQYQREYAHTAIDAGCDAVFGHHPHIASGVEVYDGVPILYSIGDFAKSSKLRGESLDPGMDGGGWGVTPPEERYTFDDVFSFEGGPNQRYFYRDHVDKAVLAKITLAGNGEGVTASLIPITIEDSQPVAIQRDEPQFEEILEFIEWSSKAPNSPDIPEFETEFQVEDGEIVIRNS